MADLKSLTIGIVGPCKAGKTVLKRKLVAHGLTVRHIAQEHSYVQDMWRQLVNPDVLIYLAVSFETTLDRSSLSWNNADYEEQLRRLDHARDHADLVIITDNFTPDQISKQVLDFLEKRELE
jgi:deoxyadenosine/deoxycytidine kinase